MQFGEFSWTCSTTFDIFLFMVEVTILCWIQFYCLVKEAAYIAKYCDSGVLCVPLGAVRGLQ